MPPKEETFQQSTAPFLPGVSIVLDPKTPENCSERNSSEVAVDLSEPSEQNSNVTEISDSVRGRVGQNVLCCWRKRTIKGRKSALLVALIGVILLIFFSRPSSGNPEAEMPSDVVYLQAVPFHTFPVPEPSFRHEGLENSHDDYRYKIVSNWKTIKSEANLAKVVHFKVGTKSFSKVEAGVGRMTNQVLSVTYTDEETVQINGRPPFCTETNRHYNSEFVTSLHFGNATHLHLSEMSDCNKYVHLILTAVSFPNIRSIRLHKVVINENEFKDISKFIDRHNETLQKVEIDECYLCPSPHCDAGMINFPEHDFQLSVTRHRDSTKDLI